MQQEPIHLKSIELSAVAELTNIGVGHAATALSQMTGRKYNMTIPQVLEIPISKIPFLFGDENTACACIYMPVEGEVRGDIAFFLQWEHAVSLWRALLGTSPDHPTSVDELSSSTLMEVGNIINSSFLNAIADLSQMQIVSTPPLLAIDSATDILATIVSHAVEKDAIALSVETHIYDEDLTAKGYFLVLPGLPGLRSLLSKFGLGVAA